MDKSKTEAAQIGVMKGVQKNVGSEASMERQVLRSR